MFLGENKVKNRIEKVFEQGYAKAIKALSQLIHEKIHFENSLHKFTQVNNLPVCLKDFKADFTKVLTTELFGDIAGKSYWVLDNQSYDLITKNCNNSVSIMQLDREFIKELDNIISAAVISRLSEELSLNLYGDIPLLIEECQTDLCEMVITDFRSWSVNEVYVNGITLSFDSCPNIKPFFLWVLDGKQLKLHNSEANV